MAKEQTIRVIGYTNNNLVARTYEAGLVVKFENFSGTVMMYENPAGDYRMITQKGSYILKPDPSKSNQFIGIVGDGIKARFTKKKLVGKLIYWS